MRHNGRPGIEHERRRGDGWQGEPRSKGDPAGERHGPRVRRGREGRRSERPAGRGRGRVRRGDVRTAILLLLADEPMHGYQIMQAMSDRTGGAWRPSPGAVYPTIAQLEDEGLVTTREEGGRRLVTLTSEGQAYLEERSARLGDPFADFADGPRGPDLRDPLHELQAAARQIASGGTGTQIEAAARVLAQARRSLYLILAGETEDADV
jgi:DNA-binding PadR family transcriptional regulator